MDKIPVVVVDEDPAPPESWEVADVEESMKKLLLSSSSTDIPAGSDELSNVDSSSNFDASASGSGVADGGGVHRGSGVSEDDINQVDQFLREALQNPRERLSVLRMEQDVEKFIRDPMRQQLEFQQLPTSYLRLAAHRVAQHYFLQSMVLLDNSLPDGSGSRIIVCKTSTVCQLPHVRLVDIPVILPQENSSDVKLAIKQRPQKISSDSSSGNSGSGKASHSKSVEERKEEYSRARARIFNSTSHSGSSSPKRELERIKAENLQHVPVEIPKVDKKSVPAGSDLNIRSVVNSSTGSSQPVRTRAEHHVTRYRPSNKVAIFRDRDVESKDPDYDRSYDRYMQRFDPGFGYNTGLYTVQPMFAPAINYTTEFPQLGVVAHRPQMSAEPLRPLPQHLHGMWASPSNPALGYGHPETMMTAFSPNHVNARSPSTIYLHAPQYPPHPPGVPFIHLHEHMHQIYQQSQRQPHDAAIGLARPH